jgi:ATP-dependent RNA helicase DBP3
VLAGGRDIIGIAETGSGKTLTFALPGLLRVRRASGNKGKKGGSKPRMLVLAPTRCAAATICQQVALPPRYMVLSHCILVETACLET